MSQPVPINRVLVGCCRARERLLRFQGPVPFPRTTLFLHIPRRAQFRGPVEMPTQPTLRLPEAAAVWMREHPANISILSLAVVKSHLLFDL